jgi:glutathione S-transferase
MALHWSPRSPFVRKVMVAAHELGLVDQLELRRSVVAMGSPNPQVMSDNPLNKIPTLLLQDGTMITDSLVICDYFDSLGGGGKLIPPSGQERWVELTRHALANGWLDILILWRNELSKPEAARTAAWLAAFELKTNKSLAYFDAAIPAMRQAPFGIASITLGCCLSYLDFRFTFFDWRTGHPQLTAWLAEFRARPSAQATEAVDDL